MIAKDMKMLIKYPALRTATSYTMPDTVETMWEDAFCNLQYLENLTVSANFRPIDSYEDYQEYGFYAYLGARDFWISWSLKNVNVPITNQHYSSVNGVVYSKDGKTLLMCPMGKTGEFTVPSGVDTIGEYAFGYCKYLTKVTLPSSLTEIEDLAFANCEALKEIYIPANVTNIDFGAFSATKVTFASNHSVYTADADGVVYNKAMTMLYYCPSGVVNYTVKDTVLEIGEYAFAYNETIKTVVIPSSVTVIGMRAFLYSSVEEITIQGTVVIDYEAFFRSELKVLNLHGLTEQDWWNGIEGMEWDAVEDCLNFTTINFGGTREEWDEYGPQDNFQYFYCNKDYVKIVVNFVTSNEDSITYERTY